MDRMKAAVLFELNAPLRLIELPLRQPQRGQVLVKVMATGLCHAQLLEIQGTNAIGPMNPNLLGHEGAGIVEAVGEGVTKVTPGDHVILSWIKGSGVNVLPEVYEHEGAKINCGFVTTFNEYSLASENRVTKIPKEMPFREASIIGCAVATGAAAVWANAELTRGTSALVSGVGGVGINMLHAAALSGAYPLIALDVQDDKLALARRLGASHTIHALKDDVSANIQSIVGGPLDYAFDTTGRKDNIELLYNSVKKETGMLVLAGKPKQDITIDPFPLFYGRQLKGTGAGWTNPNIDYPRYCSMFLRGEYKIQDMISHVLPLERINEGFDLMRAGQCCRVVIDFQGGL